MKFYVTIIVGGDRMYISYEKLWKTLIDKHLQKTDLISLCGISSRTLTKLSKNENIKFKTNAIKIFLSVFIIHTPRCRYYLLLYHTFFHQSRKFNALSKKRNKPFFVPVS